MMAPASRIPVRSFGCPSASRHRGDRAYRGRRRARARPGGQDGRARRRLKYTDTKLGDGAVAEKGLHRVGELYRLALQERQQGRGVRQLQQGREAVAFTLGKHQVINGWEEGISGMKAGGKRTLIIPPSLAYGASGASGVIPPTQR